MGHVQFNSVHAAAVEDSNEHAQFGIATHSSGACLANTISMNTVSTVIHDHMIVYQLIHIPPTQEDVKLP